MEAKVNEEFLQAEIYYLRKDLAFKSINAVFVLGSILLVVIIGNHGGYELSSPMQPLKLAGSFSLFLYLVIPMHACFFSTEGFEYGSVQNIIASGQSRPGYYMGKYMLELLAIFGGCCNFSDSSPSYIWLRRSLPDLLSGWKA